MTDATLLIERLNAHMGRTVFTPGKSTFSEEKLPFYHGVTLISATTLTTVPMITRRFVGDAENLVTLDGTEECMEEVNTRFPPVLNDENVLAYLDFYLSAVRTEQGYFRFIRSTQDLNLNVEEGNELISVMDKLIAPPAVTKDGNAYFIKGFVLLNTTLYHTELTVLADGDIEMTDARPAYENLPVPVREMLR